MDGGSLTRCNGGRAHPLLRGGEQFISVDDEIDLLFVIDNSNHMLEKQTNLAKNLPRLFEALRTPAFGSRLPSLHIGVISTDLGAGGYGLSSCEMASSDGGKLLAKPRSAGCVGPTKPYIESINGVTNIQNPAAKDPVDKVIQALQCIIEIGVVGCGFEMLLEAARRALDPKLNRNPGFLRKDAQLAMVFLTDEDDCSAAKPQLFDPAQTNLTGPLGPLTSFRCFEFGVQCTCSDGPCSRLITGPRQGCKPAHDWLYKVEDYISIFNGLKPAGRMSLFAIAGPTDVVEVKMFGGNPGLKNVCTGTMGSAHSAIRLEAVIAGVDKTANQGHFNRGLDASDKPVPVSVCSPDYSPALRHIGRVLTETISPNLGVCLPTAPLTAGCGLACHKGDLLGAGVACQASCLERAVCEVPSIPRCAGRLLTDLNGDACTVATCPCWRVTPNQACARYGAPYRLEVLYSPAMPKTYWNINATCELSMHPWGSAALAGMPQCL